MSATTALSMAMPMSVPSPKGRILCVDDEPNILRALCWLLQKEFEVVTATSGREGLELVRRDDFDVVISDQRMPEMSGVDFLREVRAIAPRAMRILLTGYSDLQAILHSVNESEIFRYITKPWNISELPRVVAQAAEIARSQLETVAAPASAAAAVADTPRKILALDDNVHIHALIQVIAGDLAPVIPVTSVADAVRALQDEPIGVVVGETRPGSMDFTRLISLIRQRYPEVVSVVLAEEAEGDVLTRLVNQGQIFRFVPRPLDSSYLRECLRGALERNRQIRQQPALARRFEAETLSSEEVEALQAELAACRRPAPPPVAGPAAGPAGRFGAFLRRLFIGARRHA